MNAVPIHPYNHSPFSSLVTAMTIALGALTCAAFIINAEPMGVTTLTSPLVGTFHGTLVEAGGPQLSELSTDSVDTVITELPNGSLTGIYSVKENGTVYSGRLSQIGSTMAHNATFEWTDQFGHGTVDVSFDSDYCKFDGRWRNDEGTMLNEPWSGHR